MSLKEDFDIICARTIDIGTVITTSNCIFYTTLTLLVEPTVLY